MRAQASYTITAVKDGNDLDSILMLWKKTTTNVAPAKPDGTNLNGWATEMPEFESGAYVWTCNRVVISDPTAATPIYIYTDPVLDTHWQKLDEVYKQGTDIKNTVDNITLKYYNTAGEETSFKLTNGAIDITLLKNQVDAAATTATNFISMRSDGGIEVGNKSGGSWTGYRSQMLASEFNILNASGSKLASYGASEIGFYDGADNKIASFKPNEISLGMNNADAVISFCNNKGTFAYDADNGGLFMESKTWDIYAGDDSKYYSYVFVSPTAIELSAEYDAMAVNGYYTRMSMDTDSVQFSVYDRFMVNAQAIDLNALTVDSNGRLRRSTEGVSWFRGREAAVYGSGNTLPNASAYFPLMDVKSQYGDYSVGCLGDTLYFVYTSNDNYNNEVNNSPRIGIDNRGNICCYNNIESPTFGGDSFWGVSGSNSCIYYRGNEVCVESRGGIWLRSYWSNSDKNPNSYDFILGVVNSSYGPCLRPAINGTCTLGANNYGVKYIYATNTGIISTSDERLKENISYDFSKLEKLFGMLKPITYEYKHLDDDDNIRMGFVAQDVWSALETCGYDPRRFAAIHAEDVDPESDLKEYIDTDETYFLNYTEFTALNTYMIQKLMKRIEELEKRIA